MCMARHDCLVQGVGGALAVQGVGAGVHMLEPTLCFLVLGQCMLVFMLCCLHFVLGCLSFQVRPHDGHWALPHFCPQLHTAMNAIFPGPASPWASASPLAWANCSALRSCIGCLQPLLCAHGSPSEIWSTHPLFY